MSDYKENVALFSKPQSTYTGETGDGGTLGTSEQNGGVPDHAAYHASTDGPDPSLPNKTKLHSSSDGTDLQDKTMFNEVLSSTHEKAMSTVGFGRMQWILAVVIGLGMMGDSVDLTVVAYVLPSAERDLCMDDPMKGWLGAMAFLGMMVGAVLWGNLADKIGRRTTLLAALLVNGVMAVTAAFAPNYWFFLACRFFCGLGIGGSIPIVFTYFIEFCPVHQRGKNTGLLLIFWGCGFVYVSVLAVLLISDDAVTEVSEQEKYSFSSWRTFILVSSIPVFLSCAGLVFMPESPRYLLQRGRDLEALSVYRRIYKWNHTEAGAEYEMPEIELPSRTSVRTAAETPSQKVTTDVIQALKSFWNSFFQLFMPPLLYTTIVLVAGWFTASFGIYGIGIWFPEYIKKLHDDIYTAQRTVVRNVTISQKTFLGELSNVYYYNCTLSGTMFRDIFMQHVTFDMCILQDVTFENVTAMKTYFVESIVNDCTFNYTNFYPSRFQGTLFRDTTISHLSAGCQVDFDPVANNHKIFLENFLAQLSVIPGSIAAAFLTDRLGRRHLLCGSMAILAFTVFFIWAISNEIGVVVLNAIFNFFTYGAWASLEIASVENYPTELRSTGCGFLTGAGRIAAILGNVAFGNFITVSKAIPILLTAAILGSGALISTKLPESIEKLL